MINLSIIKNLQIIYQSPEARFAFEKDGITLRFAAEAQSDSVARRVFEEAQSWEISEKRPLRVPIRPGVKPSTAGEIWTRWKSYHETAPMAFLVPKKLTLKIGEVEVRVDKDLLVQASGYMRRLLKEKDLGVYVLDSSHKMISEASLLEIKQFVETGLLTESLDFRLLFGLHLLAYDWEAESLRQLTQKALALIR